MPIQVVPQWLFSGLGLLAVPSFSTLQSLRKSIIECGNTCPLTQKHLVQLDWVSKEDGSHILTVAVGSKVMLFTPVSSDLAQANMKAMKESQTTNRPILRKASSLAVPQFVDEIRQGLNRNVNNEYLKELFNLRGPHFTSEHVHPRT
uniref:Uncharacterized protein n=1 Tax=Timema monikensis TaxID=170555 RepID=A0A7R9E0B1_9NEOP|nr:unnamed protein product [Timema monikensis]